MAHLLNQIYIVPAPPPRHDYYDDLLQGMTGQVHMQVLQLQHHHFLLLYNKCIIIK